MNEPIPAATPAFSFRRFVERRVKFLLVAMPAACAVLLIPVDHWLLELLRHFRLWCAGLAAVLMVLTVLLKLWRWLPVAALTFAWQGLPWFTYHDREFVPPDAPPGRSFSLITCNLLYEAREPARMIPLLKAADADVIVFEEFTPEWQTAMQAELWPLYPNRVEAPQPRGGGICLVSRLPLENGRVRWDGGDFTCVSAVVSAGGSRVGVLGVHPMPPMGPNAFRDWRAAMESWPAFLQDMKAPHRIVTGDFNATPFCRTFRQLCRAADLRESSENFGMHSTWFPTPLPFGLPLDHVLLSEGLGVWHYETGPEAGSDHRWVKVNLVTLTP